MTDLPSSDVACRHIVAIILIVNSQSHTTFPTVAPTRGIAMPDTYGLNCPLARALDLIGERWSVLILRDLFLQGARKFHDFESSLAGISPNTPSARLQRLQNR